LVVLHDDASLDFGFVRVRSRGAPGKHSGMRAVARALCPGSPEASQLLTPIPRIRIGTAAAGTPTSTTNVRGDFTDAERERLKGIFVAVAAAAELLVHGQAEKSMSVFNRRDIPADQIRQPSPTTRATIPSAAPSAP
jgi:peptidyl-tRNA hydrolase